MADTTLSLILGFIVTMSGMIGAGVWKIYLHRENRRNTEAQKTLRAKNSELRALRKSRNEWKARAERATKALEDSLKDQGRLGSRRE